MLRIYNMKKISPIFISTVLLLMTVIFFIPYDVKAVETLSCSASADCISATSVPSGNGNANVTVNWTISDYCSSYHGVIQDVIRYRRIENGWNMNNYFAVPWQTSYTFWNFSPGTYDFSIKLHHASSKDVYLTFPCSVSCSNAGPDGEVTILNSGTRRTYAYGVSSGVAYMYFPTWSEVGGQNDIVWYPGINAGGGTWYADVNLASHAGLGNIYVHVYMFDSSWNAVFCDSANFVRATPVNCVGSWSSCSNGSQTYTVTTNAAYGGSSCPYSNGATQSCGTAGYWSGWSSCSASCGGGTQTRSCVGPYGGGTPCSGPSSQSCNTQTCPSNITSFSISPNPVPYGSTATLSYSCSNGYYSHLLLDGSWSWNDSGYFASRSSTIPAQTSAGSHTAWAYCYNSSWTPSSNSWYIIPYTVNPANACYPSANPSNYGASCTSSANACGQTQANGTIQCNGTCSSTPPAVSPSNYGASCTSSPNA